LTPTALMYYITPSTVVQSFTEISDTVEECFRGAARRFIAESPTRFVARRLGRTVDQRRYRAFVSWRRVVVNPNAVARRMPELVHGGVLKTQAGRGAFVTGEMF